MIPFKCPALSYLLSHDAISGWVLNKACMVEVRKHPGHSVRDVTLWPLLEHQTHEREKSLPRSVKGAERKRVRQAKW